MITAKPSIVPDIVGHGNPLRVPQTLFIGTPGVPLGALLELRLGFGEWTGQPVVSGGNLTNVTDKSVFVTVQDHANVTDLRVQIPSEAPVGEPVIMQAIVTKQGAVVSSQRYVLGYVSGWHGIFEVPFFNPSTNDRQETFLFVGAVNDAVTLRIFGTDNEGIQRGPAVFEVAPHCARVITAKQIEDGGLGVPNGKFRLTIGATAPVSIVGKVRNGFDQTLTENPVILVEG